MTFASVSGQFLVDSELSLLDVTIVMPCLNEIVSLPHCIANAMDALDLIRREYGLTGEVLVADNGSTDGSQALAEELGARVVDVAERGYGAALIAGCEAAAGRFVLMGDSDGSYDFTDGVPMIGRLVDGADLCMGSRFRGGIETGAMPWKNRYIGNPVLTGILNLFFEAGVTDAHCGIRAITAEAFRSLRLSGTGMEFASEMVIKAALRKLRIDEVPATLSRDLRDRAPHLRPWRDGWRHLRYLLMLSPTWVFGIPAAVAMACSCYVLLIGSLHWLHLLPGEGPYGASWSIVAGFLFIIGLQTMLIAITAHVYGVREGYRSSTSGVSRVVERVNLEMLLLAGAAMIGASTISFAAVGIYWSNYGYVALPNILPVVLSGIVGAAGVQTIFGGFLLSIVAGNRADFLVGSSRSSRLAISRKAR